MEIRLGWVQESDKKIDAVRIFLNALQEEALDVLGFRRINDNYADKFFPAVTTLMTRARYFIFVPSLIMDIEDSELSGSEAIKKLMEYEDKVRAALVAGDPEARGIIGRYSGRNIHQFPSDTYWPALRTLRIFDLGSYPNLPKMRYFKLLDSLKAKRKEAEIINQDNDQEGIDNSLNSWDCDFESVRLKELYFRSRLSFSLTAKERKYLRSKYLNLAADKGNSLIAWLIEQNITANQIQSLDDWQKVYTYVKSRKEKVPSYLLRDVRNALRFSRYAELLEQIYLVYLTREKWGEQDHFKKAMNYLSELLDNSNLVNIVRGFESWGSDVWGKDSFFSYVAKMLIELGFSSDKIKSSDDILNLIRDREYQKKHNKARLTNKKMLDSWTTSDPCAGAPDFRRTQGLAILREIID